MKPFNTLIMAMGAALLFSASASLADENITARFRPDPANPMKNDFENTTPISSICAAHIPSLPALPRAHLDNQRVALSWARRAPPRAKAP